jgi:type II secretion system protein G
MDGTAVHFFVQFSLSSRGYTANKQLHMERRRGFTLIELLVVIAIIGVLSSVVLASLNSARAKARDARRREDIAQLINAMELYYSDNGTYPPTAGFLNNPGHGGLDSALTPTYISQIPDDPSLGGGTLDYIYWREDYNIAQYCPGVVGRGSDYRDIYAHLENPTAADLAQMTTTLDLCMKNTYNYNYKRAN